MVSRPGVSQGPGGLRGALVQKRSGWTGNYQVPTLRPLSLRLLNNDSQPSPGSSQIPLWEVREADTRLPGGEELWIGGERVEDLPQFSLSDCGCHQHWQSLLEFCGWADTSLVFLHDVPEFWGFS